MPFELRGLPDDPCGEFGSCDVDDDVRTGRLERHDPGIHRRLGDLERLRADDHRAGLFAKTALEAFEIVLAEIVVLVDHRDFGIGVFS